MIFAVGRIQYSSKRDDFYSVVIFGKEFKLFDYINLYTNYHKLVYGKIISIHENSITLRKLNGVEETLLYDNIVGIKV